MFDEMLNRVLKSFCCRRLAFVLRCRKTSIVAYQNLLASVIWDVNTLSFFVLCILARIRGQVVPSQLFFLLCSKTIALVVVCCLSFASKLQLCQNIGLQLVFVSFWCGEKKLVN